MQITFAKYLVTKTSVCFQNIKLLIPSINFACTLTPDRVSHFNLFSLSQIQHVAAITRPGFFLDEGGFQTTM